MVVNVQMQKPSLGWVSSRLGFCMVASVFLALSDLTVVLSASKFIDGHTWPHGHDLSQLSINDSWVRPKSGDDYLRRAFTAVVVRRAVNNMDVFTGAAFHYHFSSVLQL